MIIVNNEEALRVKCEDVKIDEVGPLIDQLERELDYSNKMGRLGIGLAAPQINIAKNIAIVRINDDLKVNLINPKFINKYDLAMFRNEGCLSFPNRIEDTMRYQEVHIHSDFIHNNEFIATGLFAIVCQHEMDHLNGILLPDKAILKVKTKIRPNDLCACNSGKKYKRCCK